MICPIHSTLTESSVLFVPYNPKDPIARVHRLFRTRFIQSQRAASRQLMGILAEWHKDTIAVINRIYKGKPLDEVRMQWLARELRRVSHGFVSNIRNFTQDAILSTADLTALREGSLLKAMYKDVLPKEVLAGLVNPFGTDQLARVTQKLLWETALGNKIALSNKLWVLGEYSQDRVASIVRAGMQQGLSPVQLSKALEFELVAQSGSKDVIWSSTKGPGRLRGLIGSAPRSLKTRIGTTSYNFLRIARSETARAQRAAHLMRVLYFGQLPRSLNPVVGVRWNLSASHPALDICDEYATADPDGRGSGVYKPGNVPFPHPSCLCFTSTELLPPKRYQDNMVRFMKREKLSAQQMNQLLTLHGGTYLSSGFQRSQATLIGLYRDAPFDRDAIAAFVAKAKKGRIPFSLPPGAGIPGTTSAR